jgi:hypothetical protein
MILKNKACSLTFQVWWSRPVIQIVGRHRLEDLYSSWRLAKAKYKTIVPKPNG